MSQVSTDAQGTGTGPRGPDARPMSPHLQVWRWHVTMTTSILHRATGVALYGGAFVLAGWAMALAAGPDAYGDYMALLGSPLGKLALFGLTVALFYHLANGVRHLIWDSGRGLEVKTADASGWFVILFGLGAAIAVWALAYRMELV